MPGKMLFHGRLREGLSAKPGEKGFERNDSVPQLQHFETLSSRLHFVRILFPPAAARGLRLDSDVLVLDLWTSVAVDFGGCDPPLMPVTGIKGTAFL
ncbi:unnamed protein product [Merluccius merluccius]